MRRAILDRGRLARIFAPVGTAMFIAGAAHFGLLEAERARRPRSAEAAIWREFSSKQAPCATVHHAARKCDAKKGLRPAARPLGPRVDRRWVFPKYHLRFPLPALMNDLTTSLLIFGGALVAALAVLVIYRRLLPRLGIHIGTELSGRS